MKRAMRIALGFGGFLWVGCERGPCGPTGPGTTRPGTASTRPASGPTPGASVDLFNGRDLDGWTCVLADPDAKMEDTWSVRDGALVCTGRPSGYLRTVKDDYQDYVLELEWRWPPGTPGGNSGVLVHASAPSALGVWPKSIEVQLARGDAGDFWIIGTELDVPNEETRRKGRRHLNLTDDSEKPPGQWNHMEITCRGHEILVKVNGQLVNHATDCSVNRGAICLQSEGAPIEYRHVRLRPLEPL